MIALRLTRPLVLEAPERVPDGSGGFTESWIALGTLWAEVVPGSGRENAGAAGPVSRQSLRISVRAAPQGAPDRPQVDQRFRDGDRLFRILAVTERDAEARYLTCNCTEELAA